MVANTSSGDMINATILLPGRTQAMKKHLLISLLTLAVSACSNAPIQPPGENHLRAEKVSAGGTAQIPPPVLQTPALPKPRAAAKTETYSVVVNNVRVQELLFALARDAKLNVDIHPGIEGMVTLNAIDQTLQQLLARIAKQVDLRWELDGPNLAVMPDTPFLRTYRVDYVNMSRDTSGVVAVTTQIASTGAGATASGGAAAATGRLAAEVAANLAADFPLPAARLVVDNLVPLDAAGQFALRDPGTGLIDGVGEVEDRRPGIGRCRAEQRQRPRARGPAHVQQVRKPRRAELGHQVVGVQRGQYFILHVLRVPVRIERLVRGTAPVARLENAAAGA